MGIIISTLGVGFKGEKYVKTIAVFVSEIISYLQDIFNVLNHDSLDLLNGMVGFEAIRLALVFLNIVHVSDSSKLSEDGHSTGTGARQVPSYKVLKRKRGYLTIGSVSDSPIFCPVK